MSREEKIEQEGERVEAGCGQGLGSWSEMGVNKEPKQWKAGTDFL